LTVTEFAKPPSAIDFGGRRSSARAKRARPERRRTDRSGALRAAVFGVRQLLLGATAVLVTICVGHLIGSSLS
jgi:hypothetical protein